MTDDGLPHDSLAVDELGGIVMTALGLSVTGHHAAAVAVLTPAAETLDHHSEPTPALIDVSVLYATLCVGPNQLRVAHYAYDASHRLYKCGHPRRLAAADAYGTALHQNGHYEHAIDIRRRLLASYRIHQPQAALPAAIGLATSLHAASRCTEAHRIIVDAWNRWRDHPHDDLSTGTSLLRAAIRILRSCRRDLDLIALACRARDTPAWDELIVTRTATLTAADADYIDAHRNALCTHTPQLVTGPSATPAHHRQPQTPVQGPPAEARTPMAARGRVAPPDRPHAPRRTGPAAHHSTTVSDDPVAGPSNRLLAAAHPIFGSRAFQGPRWRRVLGTVAALLPAVALVLHLMR
jgi:hypothetical protein